MALSKVAKPPKDLNRRKLLIAKYDRQLFRISKTSRGKPGVVYFGKNGTERFDDPDSDYGVCYLAEDEYGAFIEVFGQSLETLLDEDYIYARALSTLEPKHPLRLVDVTGRGAAWISAAGEMACGDRALSQEWSKALYNHPEKVDGILYRCRHDQERFSVALFDRAKGVLAVTEHLAWSDAALKPLLGEILDHYNLGLS